jgi:hypothetical protein
METVPFRGRHLDTLRGPQNADRIKTGPVYSLYIDQDIAVITAFEARAEVAPIFSRQEESMSTVIL